MNGLLLIDKAEGVSSHDIVSQLRKKFSLRKIGHGGTLDPLASGLLILLIGNATRLAEFVIGHDKTYHVTAYLGEHRDTFDADGQISKTSDKKISEEKIRQTFAEFPREYMQIPPAYSAKKIKGIASYKLARKGQKTNLKPCHVTIHKLEIKEIQFPIVKFIAKVSSGTYIRSLVVDIAERLDTFAYVKQLRRIESGYFNVKNAYDMNTMLNYDIHQFRQILLPMSEAVKDLPKLKLTELQTRQFSFGQDIVIQENLSDKTYRVFSENNEFLGICKIENNKIVSRKVLKNEDIS